MAPPLAPETDASLGINPDTDVDTEMELGVEVLNQVDKGSPQMTQDSVNVPPPYVIPVTLFFLSLHSLTSSVVPLQCRTDERRSVECQTPSSTAQTIIAQLHAQPLNINILSWKKSTIEDILAGLRTGRIRIGSRAQGQC